MSPTLQHVVAQRVAQAPVIQALSPQELPITMKVFLAIKAHKAKEATNARKAEEARKVDVAQKARAKHMRTH